MQLYDEELEFWQEFIDKYLKPLDSDKEKEEKMKASLLELRNSVVFGIALVNLLWIAINFMFQYSVNVKIGFSVAGNMVSIDILGMLFMVFLILILCLQILGMFAHRWGTLLHLLAFTDIDLPCTNKKVSAQEATKGDFQKVLDFCKEMYNEPVPDYLGEQDEDAPQEMSMADRIRMTVLGTSSHQRSFHNSNNALGQNQLNPRAIDLYLRATRRATDEEDPEAKEFISEFRKTLVKGRDTLYRGNSALGLPNGHASGGLHRPPLPPRNDSFNPLLRRRYNNNLRGTVHNTIQRAEREGISIRQDDTRVMNQQPFGMIERAFSRRLQAFSQYERDQGSRYINGIENV